MKGLKIVGLGIAIWALSLLWPEINQLLSSKVLAGLGVSLSAFILIYEFSHHFLKRRHDLNNGGNRNDHPSRPLPPVALARR